MPNPHSRRVTGATRRPAEAVRYDSDMKWTLPLAAPCAVTLVLSACSAQQVAAQATPLTSTSGTIAVRGQYQPLRLDEVGGVSVKDGKLVVRGSFESVTLDLPPFVDTATVIRHWALVTEAGGETKKILNFAHDMSLDDFTIEIPPTDAEIRYGVFAHRQGGHVMVFTWGRHEKCYWGYLIISNPPADDASPRPGA